MRKQLRKVTALGAFFVVAVAVAACGSGVPSNSVAVVAGNPITTQAFDHWMYVAAKSQAAQNPGSPVIVADDPPNFDSCIAQVRRQVSSLAKTPAKQLRADCKQLFTSLSSQVMDFLIKGYWYQAEAARDHVKVTNAQVQSAFTAAKAQQFTSDSQFQNFLTETGQTMNDIIFRFRINTIFQKLIADHTPKVNSAAIQTYYNQHQSQFGTPATRNIRIVLAKNAAEAIEAARQIHVDMIGTWTNSIYLTDPSGHVIWSLRLGEVWLDRNC
jgi:parvulin-like peptidyl-prolyl isomerase